MNEFWTHFTAEGYLVVFPQLLNVMPLNSALLWLNRSSQTLLDMLKLD